MGEFHKLKAVDLAISRVVIAACCAYVYASCPLDTGGKVAGASS
jgi:hypothetical protein